MVQAGIWRVAVVAALLALGAASIAIGVGADRAEGPSGPEVAAGTATAPAAVAEPKVTTGGAGARGKGEQDLLTAFRGLSTWIDTYDTDLTPEEQVRIAADAGVDTLFVQTARQSTPGLVHDRARLGRTIELAHDAGLQVMVWTIPSFVDLQRDFDQAVAAMSFTTPRGDTADAFGLDIEVEAVEFAPIRTRRLLELSADLRAFAGARYPMGAIVLPPRQLEINTTWWRDFPYEGLAAHYDVFVPMSYSSYRGTDSRTTFEWNRDNVVLTRELAGVADLPVHLAGGIADDLPEVTAFVRAAFDSDAIGAGLYDLHTTLPEAWPALRALSR